MLLPAEELIQQTLKLVNASDEEEPVQAEEVEAALGELVQRWGEAIKEDENGGCRTYTGQKWV